jgi:hypothetical protein
MRICYIISSLAIFLLFFSCSTTIVRYESETGVPPVKGKTVKEKTAVLRVKEDQNDEITGILTSPLFPAVTIYGDIEQQGEGFVYYITKARLFAAWPNGWTEGFYEASGKLVFAGDDGGMTCHIEDPFTLWDIISGEIRYYDVYYRKDDGARKVKNRVDRLTDISRFLTERHFPPVYGHIKRETTMGPGFKKEIVPYLFPERRNFGKLEKNGRLPDEFYQAKGEFPVNTVWGSGLWWRTDYTNTVFPEYLRQLRNSGTLWRDYEEAPLLFFSLYTIAHVFDSAIKNTLFIKSQRGGRR